MKRELRNMLATMSVMAIAASCTTFFTGCSKDAGENEEESLVEGEKTNAVNTSPIEDRVTPVNDDNIQQLSDIKNQRAPSSNASKFSFKSDDNAVKELLEAEDLVDTKDVVLDSFKLYKKENGHYYVISKDKAFELVDTADGYSFLSDSKGHTILTDNHGARTLVFGGDEAYNEFVTMLKEKLDAVSSDVCTIVNGIYVGDHIDSMTVDTYNGEMKYYDFEAILNNCIKAIEAYDYLDPISFKKNDDGSYDVTRVAYTLVDTNGVSTVNQQDMVINVPVGDKGEIYYDSSINYMIGMPFEENGKTWISTDALLNLLGIDTVEGVYTIPGSKDAYNALMIDTANGMDEPGFVKQPTIIDNSNDESVVVETQPPIAEPNVDLVDDSVLYERWSSVAEEQPVDNYDQTLYEATGLKVELVGEPAEQAHQYLDALNTAYPGYFQGSDQSAGISIDDSQRADARAIGPEECDNIVAGVLAGRSYTDVPVGELLAIKEYANFSNSYVDVYIYLSNMFNRTFAPGHVVDW